MRAYVVRYGAFGDHVHCSHIPRILKLNGFDHVTFEYNPKGKAIYENNPFIDEHVLFNPQEGLVGQQPVSFLDKRYEYIKEEGKYDVLIDLRNSIEYGYIAMEDQSEYYLSSQERRKKYGELNYYDQTNACVQKKLSEQRFKAIFPTKNIGEIYFTDEEVIVVRDIYNREYRDKFVVICNLSGTSRHKLFYNAEYIIKEFLSRHPEAVCITIGDEDCKTHVEFTGERIVNRAGTFNKEGKFEGGQRYPFRQSMLMAKYAHLAIGCESGLMVASNAFGTPTVQLMTAASVKNHGGGMENDFSLQSPIACSPCHKGPYDYIGCPKFDHLGQKYPNCIKFDSQTVLDQMENIYGNYATRKKNPELSAV